MRLAAFLYVFLGCRRRRPTLAIVACAALSLGAACSPYYNPGLLPRTGPVVPWSLVRALPHDASSFTQGLTLVDGYLFESAGGFQESRTLKIDPRSGRVVRQRHWPITILGTEDNPFAEGIASDGTRLVQLSWENERALTWTRDLQRTKDLEVPGEGWGLCFDGAGYWRSDGSPRLHRHSSETFAEDARRSVRVTSAGHEVDMLDELECFDGLVFANVWKTPYVVIIRPTDGHVIGVLDFTRLVRDANARGRESVLNGLAWDPKRRELYVTGKRWSKLYVVQLPTLERMAEEARQQGLATRSSGGTR